MAQPVKPSPLTPKALLGLLQSFHHFCPGYFHLEEEIAAAAAAQGMGEQWLEEALAEVYLLLSVNSHKNQHGPFNISLLNFM